MENISGHITYNEAIYSETALRKGIDNTPTQEILEVMKVTAEKIFEPLRATISKIRGKDTPITVNSFYRSTVTNAAVGGAANSQHTKGEAIDMSVDYSDFSKADLFKIIRSTMEFDQLIFEAGTPDNPAWVHCSYSSVHNRKECLRMVVRNGISTYELF
jgi:hypothetical protein